MNDDVYPSGIARLRIASRPWPSLILPMLLFMVAPDARASFLQGEMLDKAADALAVVILIFVPIGAITLFWLVHILPEKIAEKRHHPQQTAIKTLCLLSLVFGGMLWPLAWLWAYTKPVAYKMAYGTDKHVDYFKEAGERAGKGELSQADREALEHEIEGLAARNQLTPELHALRARLGALHAPSSSQQPPAPPQQPGEPGGAV
jgi:hypothetical protein